MNCPAPIKQASYFDGAPKPCRQYGRWRSAAGCWLLSLVLQAQAAALLEEGFNYPAGSGLAANPPWAGSIGASVSVASGNLTLTNLQGTVPDGNLLQIAGGSSRTVYANFTSNAVTGGAVYFSTLIRCPTLPTNSQFIASLMSAGNTAPNPPDDPLDLYVTPATSGYTFRVGHTEDDPVTARKALAVNTTHFIVLKYAFGSGGQASIYIDPVPGGIEPGSPDARTSSDEGTDAANLQMLLFHSASSAGQGIFDFDTVRVATNWAGATPMRFPVSLTGPQDQAICFGSSATFSVLAAGTPPYGFQWRTNGVAVLAATNSSFPLANPGALDAANQFDVVASDAFGSVTSRVARLTFSTNAASLVVPPANQLVIPGASNVTFSVTATGDAPLSYQWRANGFAIPAATNAAFTFTHPLPTDVTNAIDVVVSNPCGSVTSSPPVGVQFPILFQVVYDAGPGFVSGENLILTNLSSLPLYVWSSPDLSVSVTNWTLEGPMTEQPLGTSGNSRYGINVNPAVSPVYYIVSQVNVGPYAPVEALAWLTTSDFASFTLTGTNLPMGTDGIFMPPQPVTTSNLFYSAYDAGAGFSGGENLIFSGPSGLNCFVWSSPSPSVSVTNWTLEGAMSEFVLDTTGDSRYGINLNPKTSPAFYIFALTNAGPYFSDEPLIWLTTSDFTDFSVISTNPPISADGIFALPTPPSITQLPGSKTVIAGQSLSFTAAAAGPGLDYQWFYNGSPITAGAGSVLTLTNVTAANAGYYVVTITNASGNVSSSFASLTVTPPPGLSLSPTTPGLLQLSASSVTGLTYIVQTATDLDQASWASIVTNNTGSSGAILFQTNAVGNPRQFYRLGFP